MRGYRGRPNPDKIHRLVLSRLIQETLEPGRGLRIGLRVTIAALVVWIISFGMTGDLNASFVGWGSSSLVSALTGYVLFRLTGGSLRTAPRAIRRIVGFYFWVGAWGLVAAVTDTAMDQGGTAAFHLAANNIAPSIVVSLVLGLVYLWGATAD